MDNPKLNDVLVVGRFVLCACLCALLTLARPAYADRSVILAQQAKESQPVSSPDIQKIQRLLKRLADQYPERYRSVDPGSLDGVYGESTKIALRRFRAIAGLVKDPRPDSLLAPAILAEFAAMTAADPDSRQTIPPLGCAQTPGGEECPAGIEAAAPTTADSATTATSAPKEPASESRESASAQPTRGALDQNGASDAKPAPTPASSGNSLTETVSRYFVQVASLRSTDAAQQEWSRIKSDHRDTLQNVHNLIETVDISGRGVFYRVLVGPLPNRDDAKSLCDTLRQNGQTCMVLRRSLAAPNVADTRQAETGKGGSEPARAPLQAQVSHSALSSPAAVAASPHPGRSAEQPVSAKPATPAAAAEQTAAAVDIPAEPPVRTAPAASAPAAPPAVGSSAPAPQELARAPIAATPGDENAKTRPRDAAVEAPKEAPSEDLGDFVAAAARDSAKAQAEAKADAKVAAPAPPRSLEDRAIGFARKIWRKLRELFAPALLVFVLVGGFLLYKAGSRRRLAALAPLAVQNVEATDRFPLPGMEEENIGEIRSLSVLEDAFNSERLQNSRRIRDAFLREVLFDEADKPTEHENRESAIRVNTRLKRLLATDPERYKSIFFNLIFLSKVGAALNRKDITFDQLNGCFSRELDLLQSYFKIHLLELDDRHRIRKDLPGLFYCLQISQLQKGPLSAQFSAA